MSAGVAPNKFLAKIASGWKKPDGLTVIAPERVEDFLQKLPVDALWGVGRRRRRGCAPPASSGWSTCAPRTRPRSPRSSAAWPAGCATSPTASTSAASSRTARSKSSGSECTYTEDLTDLGTIQAEVAKMAEAAARWLEKRDTVARTVTLKLRYKDFRTITRSHSAPATRDAASIIDRAVQLVDKTDAGATPVRLLGVSVSNFGADEPVIEEPDGDPKLPFE